jgi:hypothetical protein
MKRRIDLQRAAEAETYGALAVGAKHKQRRVVRAGGPFTPAQSRALSDLARSLVQIARDAGAEQKRITVSGVTFELHENGTEEILSIRTGTDP